MKVTDLTWEVRDKNLTRLGQIRPEDLDVELTDLVDNVGSWKLTLPVEHPMTQHLRTPGAGLLVTRNDTGETLFSGPVVTPTLEKTVNDPLGSVTFEGVSDAVCMADRLAVPDPNNPDLDDQGLAHDTRTGPIEDLMFAFVNANAGPGAPVARRVAHLVMGTSLHRGATVKKSARFPVLGNLLGDLIAGTLLHWRIRQTGSSIVFDVLEATDRRADIRLDIENNTLAGLKVATSPPGATRVLVAGQGDLVERQFIEMTSTEAQAAEAAWGRRIERFVDQRQTNDMDELTRAGQEVLDKEGFSTVAVQVVPMEDTDMDFLANWFPGDLVTAVVEGQETVTPVTGYILKANKDGFRLGAVLGDPAGFNADVALSKRVDGISARLSNLERNAETPAEGRLVTMVSEPLPQSAPATDYPLGVSIQSTTTGSGWSIDGGFGTVVTYNDLSLPTPRAHQEFVVRDTASRLTRPWNGTAWGPWLRITSGVVAIRYQPLGSIPVGTTVFEITLPGERTMGNGNYVISGFATERNDGNFGSAVIRLESAAPVTGTWFRAQITNTWHTPLNCYLSYTLTPVQG